MGGGWTATDLHHQHDRVEGDQSHDGVLERGRHHEFPHLVLEGLPVLWHVSGQRLGVDGKVNAGPLLDAGGDDKGEIKSKTRVKRAERSCCPRDKESRGGRTVGAPSDSVCLKQISLSANTENQ